jgi:hypothetical protein
MPLWKKNVTASYFNDTHFSPKPTAMLAHPFLVRLLIFGFMILVGTSMASNIQARNLLGFLLSLISLVAGAYVIYLLGKLKETEREERN